MTILLKQLPCANRTLENAAEQLFTRSLVGHLDPFSYSVPTYEGDPVRGAAIWQDFILCNSHYRIAQQEAALIRAVAPQLRDIPGIYNELIDFGPGSLEAFHAKTMPLIDQLRIQTYRPIDLCEIFLADIERELPRARPDIRLKARRLDFLNDHIATATGPSWLYWGGNSFANIPTKPADGLPVEQIAARLSKLKGILRTGGHCLLALDTNRDHMALMRAYNHPLCAEHTLNILHRISRDCPNIVFDPTAWWYRPVWRPKRLLLEFQIVATRDQTIEMPSGNVCVKAGNYFVTEHSFKLPTSIISRIAHSVGWKRSAVFGNKGGVQLLLLST